MAPIATCRPAIFEVTLLKDLHHAEDSPYNVNQPPHPPLWGPGGEYFGHEWSRWRYDTLDERVDGVLAQVGGRGAAILDIGCASGVKAAHFAASGHAVTAVDIIDRSKEIAARNADFQPRADGVKPSPIAFIRADARDLAALAALAPFDVIHARRVLNFMSIAAVDVFFGTVANLLRDDGVFAASFIVDDVKDARDMTRRARRGTTPPLPQGPGMEAHHFSEVHDTLREHGLIIVEGFADFKIEAGFIARLEG